MVVPTDKNCGGTPPCSWTGNFTSSSGRLWLKNVDISSGAQEVGKPFGGLYEGSTFIGNQVYPYGSHQWIWDIWFLVWGKDADPADRRDDRLVADTAPPGSSARPPRRFYELTGAGRELAARARAAKGRPVPASCCQSHDG